MPGPEKYTAWIFQAIPIETTISCFGDNKVYFSRRSVRASATHKWYFASYHRFIRRKANDFGEPLQKKLFVFESCGTHDRRITVRHTESSTGVPFIPLN